MTKIRRSFVLPGLVLLGLIPLQRLHAQSPGAGTPPAASAQQPAVPDPLGRSTPQGTVIGLITAVQHDDLERAAQYLDSGLRPQDRQALARKLGDVLDRNLSTSLGSLSSRPEGNLTDGLGAGHDRVGLIQSESGEVEIVLDRVQRGAAGAIWLFASDTLQEIPRLYDEVRPPWIEQYLPERLRTARLLSTPLYRIILLLLAIPLIFGVSALLTRILTAGLRPLLHRFTGEPDAVNVASLGPLRVLVLAFSFYAASYFGLSLRVRRFWSNVALTLTVIAVCWLLLRVIDVVAGIALRHLQRLQRPVNTALVHLIDRLIKAAMVTVAGLVLLYFLGFDLTAVLAGLGVGGLAIGFGAQKTIENLFGGIMVISDRPISVGDTCRAGDFVGTVEDIGLRSTRIRTPERTVVSIPNGQLASMSLENFAARDRIWFHHTVGLQYLTTAGQLRQVLSGIQALLEAHPRVERASARTRLIRFGAWSLDIEVYAYVLETDYAAFLAIQEELLLGIMDTVEASGTSVALPWRAEPPLTESRPEAKPG